MTYFDLYDLYGQRMEKACKMHGHGGQTLNNKEKEEECKEVFNKKEREEECREYGTGPYHRGQVFSKL